MALELGQFDVMSYLWETLEKTPDGEHIRYTIHDVDMLWHMGFVDTQRVAIEEWRAVFEPFRDPQGFFVLNHDAFLSLDPHRYTGEIHVPFDAMLINEGRYTDTGFQELIDMSVTPSCSFPPAQLNAFFINLKTTHRDAKGLIVVGNEAKLAIKKLLEDHPSPLRNLELLFDQMVMAGTQAEVNDEVAAAQTRFAERETTRQTSHFFAKPTSRSEASAKSLQAMAKAKQKSHADTDSHPTTELKKIRRSRKGMRG